MITYPRTFKREGTHRIEKKPSKRREYQEGCEIVLSKYSLGCPVCQQNANMNICKKKFKPENYFIGNLSLLSSSCKF